MPASCSYAQELPTKIAAPMAVSPDEALPRVQARRLDRCQQAALVAAGQAWVQAGSEVDSRRLVGHLMGAAGAVEAIITVVSIANSVVPPTLKLQRKAPEIQLDIVVDAPREQHLTAALCNFFGFGGQNVSLLFTAS